MQSCNIIPTYLFFPSSYLLSFPASLFSPWPPEAKGTDRNGDRPGWPWCPGRGMVSTPGLFFSRMLKKKAVDFKKNKKLEIILNWIIIIPG
jgi:hypothetical protein